ncbi:hypothetical protein Tco_0606109 [Tanacetum coccineum]
MTKVIKAEFEKLEDLKVKDVSLTCDTSLEVFNIEFNQLSEKDDDSEQRVSHEADDDTGYDPSDVAFTEWLRGDDEVELTDEEFSDNKDEVAENYLQRTLRDSRLRKSIRMIGSMNGTEMYHGLMRNHKVTLEFRQMPHHWKNDGYCNGGNVPGTYIVGNLLHYKDYKWYEALMDYELKEQDLRNKAIIEGLISDDESSNDGWRRWDSHENTYHNHNELENETHDERKELCEAHELLVCKTRRFEMIKYSFG